VNNQGEFSKSQAKTTTSARSYNTKYLLQTRNAQGHIITLGKYDYPVTAREVIEQFGPRDYTLKTISPRFATLWKYKSSEKQENTLPANQEIKKLKRETKYHRYAIIGLGVLDAIGFGLSHLRFNDSEARLARLEAVATTLPAKEIQCTNCGARTEYMLQQFCGACGIRLLWPNTLPKPSSGEPAESCAKCQTEIHLRYNYCPSCGAPRPVPLQLVRFYPTT
jgi:ribosomal protein L37E